MSRLTATMMMFLAAGPSAAFAAAKKAPTVTITYTGSGSADVDDSYTETIDQQCRVDTGHFTEHAGSAKWSLTWKNLPVLAGGGPKPKPASFSALISQNTTNAADLSKCPPFQLNECAIQDPDCILFSDQCSNSRATFDPGSSGELEVAKSGKTFVVTLKAEQQLATRSGGSGETCQMSSAFNNNIVDGLHGINITQAKFKLTAATKSKTTTLKIPLAKVYSCKDPARAGAPFLGSTCRLTSSLKGTVVVQGKWTAKL